MHRERTVAKGVYDHHARTYLGPTKSVYGEFGTLGATFFIHFVPSGNLFSIRRPTSLRETAKFLAKGTKDLLDFISLIETNENFDDLIAIRGTTDYVMASFVMKNLKFRLLKESTDTRTDKQIIADAKKQDGVRIRHSKFSKDSRNVTLLNLRIRKEDLVAQKEHIQNIHAEMNRFLEEHPLKKKRFSRRR